MAARLGIVALRDTGVPAFRKNFPMLERIEPEETGGWTWAAFNLFGYGSLVGPQAEAILRERKAPGLQAWTEDGALWYLMLYAPGRLPYRHVHWFRYNAIADGDEKPGRDETLRSILDEYEDGLPEDYKFAGELPGGPLRSAMAEFLRRRAEDLIQFLRDCGVPHDRGAVRAALTGESVTPEEWEWDVGNLPRLLDAMGLAEVIPGWRDQIEADRAEVAEAREAARLAAAAPKPDLAEPILRAFGGVTPAPIRGGAVVAPLERLWLLPWSCETDAEIALVVRPSRPARVRWPKAQWLSAVERGGVWRVGHPWVSVGQRAALFRQLNAAIARLPDGSAVDMVTANLPDAEGGEDLETAVSTAGNMWFQGVLQGGAWKVTHAHPEVTKKDLQAALAILDWIPKREPFRARSAAEATALAERAIASGNFGHEKKDQPTASGSLVRIAPLWRPYLAQIVFRLRFPEGPWNFAAAEAEDQEMAAEFEKLLAGIGEKFNQAFAAPREAAVVLRGAHSTYRSADILQIQAPSGLVDLFRRLYPARDFGKTLDLPAAVRTVDESMASLGFAPLGDLVCEAFGDIVLRGYGRPQQDAYALLYAGTIGQFLYEFYTDFTDGSSLTTSIHHGKTHREMKSFHVQYPNASVEELFEKHGAGVAQRTGPRVKTATHPLELAALAARIDAFLARSAA